MDACNKPLLSISRVQFAPGSQARSIELPGGVFDAEPVIEFVRHFVEKRPARIAAGHHDIAGFLAFLARAGPFRRYGDLAVLASELAALAVRCDVHRVGGVEIA